MLILRVSSTSPPAKVAGAIAWRIREEKRAVAQAIGQRAVHRAIKAVIHARRYLAEEDIDLICLPELIDVEIEGQERTAVRLIVEPR